MSTILALESSSEACSVALLHEGHIEEIFELAPRQHTRRLLPMVDQLLRQQSIAVQDCDAIAFSAGPGSFTGLRIAVGLAQGLGFACDLPLISVPTLAAMAATARRTGVCQGDDWLLTSFDARMDEVYFAAFDAEGNPIIETCVCAVGELPWQNLIDRQQAAALQAQSKSVNLVGIGDGWRVLDKTESARQLVSQYHPDFMPRAYDIAVLAQDLWNAGNTVSAELACPEYIRNTVSWKKLDEQGGHAF